jgi:hypothetical protein
MLMDEIEIQIEMKQATNLDGPRKSISANNQAASATFCPKNAKAYSVVIASAAKQSILSFCWAMDCFAEPVIGRAFARPVGSQ